MVNHVPITHCLHVISLLKVTWPWFDLSRSPEVKFNGAIWKHTYDFLFIINSNHVLITHRLHVRAYWMLHDLDLTFQGHLRSNPIVLSESPHMTSYSSSIVTMCLSHTVCMLEPIESYVTLIWPFKVTPGQIQQCHLKAHIWLPIHHQWELYGYHAPFRSYSQILKLNF